MGRLKREAEREKKRGGRSKRRESVWPEHPELLQAVDVEEKYHHRVKQRVMRKINLNTVCLLGTDLIKTPASRAGRSISF